MRMDKKNKEKGVRSVFICHYYMRYNILSKKKCPVSSVFTEYSGNVLATKVIVETWKRTPGKCLNTKMCNYLLQIFC